MAKKKPTKKSAPAVKAHKKLKAKKAVPIKKVLVKTKMSKSEDFSSKKSSKQLKAAAPVILNKKAAVKTIAVKDSKLQKNSANLKSLKEQKGKEKVLSSAVASSTSKRSSRHHAANASPICREVACELVATTQNYCRMHYIKNWKKIKRKESILKEKKLNHYIEELVSKYPDKYIEAIRQDLASEKDFAKVISDLEIEEGLDDFDIDTESAEGIIDNIKRDFDDEGDVF